MLSSVFGPDASSVVTPQGRQLFHAAYESCYEEVAATVEGLAASLPHFGPIVANLHPEVRARQDAESRALLAGALLRNEWEPYLESVGEQGEIYAEMGVPDSEWNQLVVAFRPILVTELVRTLHTQPDDLCQALLAMDGFLALVLKALRRGYADRMRALEAQLALQHVRNAAVLRGSLSAIVTMSQDGKITEFNPAAEELFGCGASDAIGTELAALLIPPMARAAHRAGLDAFLQTGAMPAIVGQRRLITAQRADGTRFPAQLSIIHLEGVEPPQFSAFVQDLSQVHQVQAELERSLAELKRSNLDLEQFAYVASHDLQEPLRMVASYTQLLAQRYSGQLDERADKYIHYAVDGARRMQQLVSDLLTFSRVGTQGRPLVPVDAGQVVARVTASLRASIAESSATIAVGDLPIVRADEGQLGQLFQNLISNAIKFRAGPPQISITAEADSTVVRFRVTDNGIGIDSDHAGRLFQMFQRLHERGRYPGNGIGLALAKRIVERHGGHISLDSKLGEGTTVVFTLPLATEPTPESP